MFEIFTKDAIKESDAFSGGKLATWGQSCGNRANSSSGSSRKKTVAGMALNELGAKHKVLRSPSDCATTDLSQYTFAVPSLQV